MGATQSSSEEFCTDFENGTIKKWDQKSLKTFPAWETFGVDEKKQMRMTAPNELNATWFNFSEDSVHEANFESATSFVKCGWYAAQMVDEGKQVLRGPWTRGFRFSDCFVFDSAKAVAPSFVLYNISQVYLSAVPQQIAHTHTMIFDLSDGSLLFFKSTDAAENYIKSPNKQLVMATVPQIRYFYLMN